MSRLKLLVRDIVRKPLRTTALLFICMIMSAAVFGGTIISVSLNNGMNSLEQRLGADIIVVPKKASEKVDLENILLQGTPGYFYMDKSVQDTLSQKSGVEKVSAQYFLVSANAECCTVQVQIIGFDDDTDFSVKPWLREAYSGKLAENEIVVGSGLSTRVGHTLKLYGVECKAVGKLESTGTGLDTAVYTSSDTVRGLIKAAESKGISVLSKQSPDDVISSVYIKVKDGYDIDEVAADINLGVEGVQAVRTKSMITGIADKLSVISGSMSLLIIVVWILSAVIMLIVFTVLVNERKREFAVLRAIGFSRRQLGTQMMTETLVISFFGAALGVAVSAAIVFPFSTLIESRSGLPLLTPDGGTVIKYAALAFAAVLASGPLAAAYSAYRLSRVDTGKILREGD